MISPPPTTTGTSNPPTAGAAPISAAGGARLSARGLPGARAGRRMGVARAGPVAWVARALLRGALRRLREGRVEVVDGRAGSERREVFGGLDAPGETAPGCVDELAATVRVLSPAFYPSAAFAGNIGAAESYMRGEWTCDRLTDLCRIVVRNRDAFNAIDGPWTAVVKPARALAHWLRRNTPAGARRNIAEHYDLSNEFFSRWLDRSMMYSGALYRTGSGTLPARDLEGAQRAKLDRIVRVLGLGPQDHLAEIGTGWGALAAHAAASAGCRVTTTTISREQASLARRRMAGLGGLVEVVEEDYRDFAAKRRGRFDALASVEMVEAVGRPYLPAYFDACASLLRPGGRFLLQAIVIVDEHYEQAAGHVDFIKKHIFPGSFMPCRRVLHAEARRAGLAVREMFEMGPDYATTLAEWRRRFFEALPEVRRLSPRFDDRFIRMWEWYLCYCEAGFREGHLGVVQVLMEKQGRAPGDDA